MVLDEGFADKKTQNRIAKELQLFVIGLKAVGAEFGRVRTVCKGAEQEIAIHEDMSEDRFEYA
jgi:hypothetical protein